MKPLMPFLPAAALVTAKMMAISAFLPEVMNCFTPFNTHSFPSSLALVLMAPASEPTCGSVRQKAPSCRPLATGLRNFSFCASVPKASSGPHTTELFTEMMVEQAPSPAAISSSATATDT